MSDSDERRAIDELEQLDPDDDLGLLVAIMADPDRPASYMRCRESCLRAQAELLALREELRDARAMRQRVEVLRHEYYYINEEVEAELAAALKGKA